MLFLIRRRPSGLPRYDENLGFVIRAQSVRLARRIAAENAGDEDAMEWVDPELSDCVRLTDDGDPGVILSDFNAG